MVPENLGDFKVFSIESFLAFVRKRETLSVNGIFNSIIQECEL